MATNPTPLSRRSFSRLLAAGGVLSIASGRLSAKDPVESDAPNPMERWTAAENEAWRWYERESLRDGRWVLTGITTPVHRVTGETKDDAPGYLDPALVPAEYRRKNHASHDADGALHGNLPPHPMETYGRVAPERQAREGRPPSEWLRSMDSEELRNWLSTVDVGEAGVRGMTFWTHLTRDHQFRPLLIKGLTEAEQAKLHAAAHFGY